MFDSGERAYVYAKSCGILQKSFLGKNLGRLSGLTRLSELDRLIFSRSARELPERELLQDLERRIIGKAVKQIITLAGVYHKPPEFFFCLIRSFEYADLKAVLNALFAGEREAPDHTDIGRFATIHYDAYPDIEGMLRDTPFTSFLSGLPRQGSEAFKGLNTTLLQTKLDQLYYKTLWEAMMKLSLRDRFFIGGILAEEMSLRNAAWVLRLRTYYGMDADTAGDCLIHIKTGRKGSADLAEDALEALTLPLDNGAAWEKWKWVRFLNPRRPGESWTADPRFFQNAASVYLYTQAYRCLHLRPFSLDVVSCFVKLKQFETDLLTSVAEGLSLGMGIQETLHVLGVLP
jgi:vacuolar-type H+-ATPase subunit C/Vma6